MYNQGDKVRIETIMLTDMTDEMFKWLGKVMTIDNVENKIYKMVEDECKSEWKEHMIYSKV